MWFMKLMVATPQPVRLLLAIAITLGITLIAWKIVSKRRAAVLETPEDTPDATEAITLALEIILVAFVFTAALILAQAWTLAGTAESAGRDEQVAIAEVFAQAEAYGEQAAPVSEAAKEYAKAVYTVEATALQLGATDVAEKMHLKSGMGMLKAYSDAFPDDKADSASLVGSIRDAIRAGGDRIAATPSSAMWNTVLVLAALGIIALALGVIITPESGGARLIFLGVLSLVLTFLMFIVVELTNPFFSVVAPRMLSAVGG